MKGQLNIGVISDTHGQVQSGVYNAFAGVDFILHAGDIGSWDVIIELETIAPVKAVVGNIDVDLTHHFLQQQTFALGKRTLALQHIFHDIPDAGSLSRQSCGLSTWLTSCFVTRPMPDPCAPDLQRFWELLDFLISRSFIFLFSGGVLFIRHPS